MGRTLDSDAMLFLFTLHRLQNTPRRLTLIFIRCLRWFLLADVLQLPKQRWRTPTVHSIPSHRSWSLSLLRSATNNNRRCKSFNQKFLIFWAKASNTLFSAPQIAQHSTAIIFREYYRSHLVQPHCLAQSILDTLLRIIGSGYLRRSSYILKQVHWGCNNI
jgi:hypothetical protein